MARASKERMKHLEAEMARLDSMFHTVERGETSSTSASTGKKIEGEYEYFHSNLDMVSEPWLKDGEAICPETGLTYNANLPTSPHVDDRYYLIGENA